jgi:hypothetical protein
MDRNLVFYQVLPGQLVGSAEFLTSLIFFKPSPVPAPVSRVLGRLAGWVSKLCMDLPRALVFGFYLIGHLVF